MEAGNVSQPLAKFYFGKMAHSCFLNSVSRIMNMYVLVNISRQICVVCDEFLFCLIFARPQKLVKIFKTLL